MSNEKGQNAREMIGVLAGWVKEAADRVAKPGSTVTKSDVAILRSQLDALNALVAAVAKDVK